MIFDLFTQLDRTCGPARRAGSASAWRWCSGCVEMHGGSVTAHSDGHGRGSEFVITSAAVHPDDRDRATRTHCPRWSRR